MTDFERVRQFVVGHWPHAMCDDCIADKLELACHRANHRTKELAELPRFVVARDGCSFCYQIKEVIRFA
jgi:hypothetical protein